MDTEKLSNTKLLRYIGRISIAYCELEDEIESGICRELHGDCDEVGYLVTCKMTLMQKVDLYGRLVRERLFACKEVKKLKELEIFLSEIKEVQKFRNTIIHGIRFNDNGKMFIRQKYKNNLIYFNEMGDTDLPYKGINTRYPKYEKIVLNEKILKGFLRRLKKVCAKIDYWKLTYPT